MTVDTEQNRLEVAHMLGGIMALMVESPYHRDLKIGDLDRLVVPALRLRQFKLYRNKKRPLAYVSWAFLTRNAVKRYLSGEGFLRPGDWNSGQELWFIDIVAPYGGLGHIRRDLQEHFSQFSDVHANRRYGSLTRQSRVMTFRNVKVMEGKSVA